jgi:hypothetical protein
MENMPIDANSREYWEWAVKNPRDACLTDAQAEAMRESLDLGSRDYWDMVLSNPETYGFSAEHATALARHFTKSERVIDDSPETHYWFNLVADCEDKKREIEKWVLKPDALASEAKIKEGQLLMLRNQLEGIEAQLREPYQGLPAETKEARQDRRLQECEAAGLDFSRRSSRLPDGVGRLAKAEGVSRQAYSADVKAALERRPATSGGRSVLPNT